MTLKETIEHLDEKTLRGDDLQHSETLKAMQKSGVKDLPFVAVAMLKSEAKELLAGKPSLFDNTANDNITGKQTKRFQAFQTAFKNAFNTDARQNEWLAHYNKDSREAWIPHLYKAASEYFVARVVEQESINRYKQRQQMIENQQSALKFNTFWPNFIQKTELFSPIPDTRNDAWRSLPSSCVLVIDGFSLFHPVIRDALESSPLNSWKNMGAALLLAVPEHPKPKNSLEYLIETELNAEIGKAFARFDTHFDPLYAFELNTERRLKRWLHVGAAELISGELEAEAGAERANRDNLAFFAPQLRKIAETLEQGGVGR